MEFEIAPPSERFEFTWEFVLGERWDCDFKLAPEEIDGYSLLREQSDAEKLVQLAAAHWLDYNDRIEALIRPLSEERLDEILALKPSAERLVDHIRVERGYRYVSRRADEVGESYCVMHDCALRECPEGEHAD